MYIFVQITKQWLIMSRANEAFFFLHVHFISEKLHTIEDSIYYLNAFLF